MAWVSEQVCHSQVLAAGNVIYRPFQSKSLNHYLYFYIVMYKICITNVFCSNLSVKSETPILYLMLHALESLCLNAQWSLCDVTKTVDTQYVS